MASEQQLVVYQQFPHLVTLRLLAGYEIFICTDTTDDELPEDADDAEEEEQSSGDSELSAEQELLFLRSLDPKEWKSQDHYAVLGLRRRRWRATDKEIKTAYRRMVLKHHPDKRKARGEVVADESTDYFTCITRAWEMLGSRSKRMSYDSVDPEFDESVPTVCEQSRRQFYSVFGPVFASNARWSRRQPVPQLGADADPREKVEDFYSFWYSFDSWREFSYLDEEDKERGENREERRWIERQNREARQRRRKEEIRRLLSLVDAARECDPRLSRFKEADRAAKEAAKQKKAEAARRQREEAERQRLAAEEAERRRREEAEAAARAEAERQRREREAAKKALKEARRAFHARCKAAGYFSSDAESRVARMEAAGVLADGLSAEELLDLRRRLEEAADATVAASLLDEAAAQLQRSRQAKLQQQQQQQQQGAGQSESAQQQSQLWTYTLTSALVKAVKLFPAGTAARWEKVSDYVNQHCDGQQAVSAKEALKKAKELAKNEDSLRSEANKQAFARLATSVKTAESVPKDASGISQRDPTQTPWTAEEQKLLEAALRRFGGSEPDRWDKIAGAVGTRTKRDCMLRYKQLVQMLQAKKAQAS